jgi:hypothetical protein
VTSWGNRVQHRASWESGLPLVFMMRRICRAADEAVAGAAVIFEDQVAALLAAEVEAVAQHFIDDVFIAHGGAEQLAAGLGE